MHSACFQAYACTHYVCPICSKSMGDMAVYFGMLDALLGAEELPEEYRDRCEDILCNDWRLRVPPAPRQTNEREHRKQRSNKELTC
ncbi:hypothetical protein F0562_025139 [Nyssa sinensis]|uniref:RCHY1 zinc-ribbon domain-containing protein n=1 Tax=Nyssa sinensis TaxID=561372 RepID=A0A5J5BEU1_9ASTE|nr:hypothetical protein F0562_025139 [Nyssa sinensis]